MKGGQGPVGWDILKKLLIIRLTFGENWYILENTYKIHREHEQNLAIVLIYNHSFQECSILCLDNQL